MSIWNKVLVGLLIVVGTAYLVFAARALKHRSHWGETVNLHEAKLSEIAKENQLLLDGDPAAGKPGVRQLIQEVHALVIGRGRAWRGSVPRLVKAETGEATVMTQLPAPHRDVQKTHLFVFEEPSAQTKGAFLGEFLVTAAANLQWQLQPVRPMTDAERERLRQSAAKKATWSMYEVMPGEPMEAAAEEAAVAGAEGAKPEATKTEGAQPVKAGSPEWQQKLIDYQVLLTELYRQRGRLEDMTAVATADTQSVESADAAARQGVELLRKDIAATKEEVKTMRAEVELVAKHLAAVQAKHDELKKAVGAIEKTNLTAASELARLQLEAIRRIDERTSKVARAAAAY